MVRIRTNPRGSHEVEQGLTSIEAGLDQILARLGNLEQEIRVKDKVDQEIPNNQDEGEK